MSPRATRREAAAPVAITPLGQEATDALIAAARASFARVFDRSEYPDLDFDQDVWLVAKPRQRKGRWSVSLTPDHPDGRPLPPTYAGIVKAHLLDKGLTGNAASDTARVARQLWEVIEARIGDGDFRWGDLRPADLEATEARWLANPDLSVGYRRANADVLSRLHQWLRANHLCDGFEWHAISPRPERGAKSAPTREQRLDRLPSRAALEGLARVYLHYAKLPHHRLLICAAGLLALTGFRVSELMTLPFDCLVEEERRGRRRYGLRFWNRKSRKARWMYATRWLSPMAAELAHTLLDEIRALTRDARERALVLEADPTTVPLRDPRPHLTAPEVCDVLGLSARRAAEVALGRRGHSLPNHRAWPALRAAAVPDPGHHNRLLYPEAAVRAALLEQRGPLHSFDPLLGDDKRQRLSDTLFIAWDGLTRVPARKAAPCKHLVVALTASDFRTYLCGQSKGGKRVTQSVFERFDVRETATDAAGGPDAVGTHPVIRTHMLRHWLNTVANRAGMTAYQITLWMQRRDALQTLEYLHAPEEIAEITREDLRDGRLVGPLASRIAALPPEEREVVIATVTNAHKLETGTCVADISGVDDCDREKACDCCPLHLRRRGAPQERAALARRRERFARQLRVLDEHEGQGVRIHPRLRAKAEASIHAIDASLASDTDTAA